MEKLLKENAIIKAKTIMEATGEIALADDSGLEVDYLVAHLEFILQDF